MTNREIFSLQRDVAPSARHACRRRIHTDIIRARTHAQTQREKHGSVDTSPGVAMSRIVQNCPELSRIVALI